MKLTVTAKSSRRLKAKSRWVADSPKLPEARTLEQVLAVRNESNFCSTASNAMDRASASFLLLVDLT